MPLNAIAFFLFRRICALLEMDAGIRQQKKPTQEIIRYGGTSYFLSAFVHVVYCCATHGKNILSSFLIKVL